SYEVKIVHLRIATAHDQSRVRAEKAHSEGTLLARQDTAESLRRAIEKFEEALRLFKDADDRSGEAATLHSLGSIYKYLSENRKSLDYYSQALSLRRAAGDRRGEAETLDSTGMVYDSLGEKNKALDCFNQSLPLWRTLGDRSGEGATLNNLGFVYDSVG